MPPASGASSPVSIRSSVVLPLPFAPMMPMRSPRRMRVETSRSDTPLALRARKGLCDAARLYDQLPLGSAAVGAIGGPCRRHALRAACPPQRRQAAQPALVALPSGGDAAMYQWVSRRSAIELMGRLLLLLQDRRDPGLEGGEAASSISDAAAIEPIGAPGQAARKARSWLMVRVPPRNVAPARSPATRWSAGRDGWSARPAAGYRVADQRAGKCGAARLAARQLAERPPAGEPRRSSKRRDAVVVGSPPARSPPATWAATVSPAGRSRLCGR